MFTLPAQSRQKCWSLSVLWWPRLHTECTDLHEAYQYDTRESQTQLSTLTLHSFYSVFIHFPPQSVPSVTKPDKNRHKSRPFTSNSITEQRRPAIMSELPLLPCINPLRSHAISLGLCVTRDFLARHIDYRGLNWRLPSQIIYTNQNNATSNITVVSAIA